MSNLATKMRSILSGINKTMAYIGVIPFCLIMLITVYEVVVRFVFNAPTIWTLEISQYFMLIAICLVPAYTLEKDGHIKVDFVVNSLSPRKKWIANILSSFLSIIFFAVLAWKSSQLTWSTFTFGEKSMTMLAIPLFPIYIFMAIGTFFLLLQGIVQFFDVIGKRG